MKFNRDLDWLKESDENDLFGDELDNVKSDEEQINEVRYIDPDNLDRYNPDEIEEVTTKSGEKRYKRKSGATSNQTTDKKEEPEKVITKEKRDATTAKVIDKLKEGASKMEEKHGRFNPYGQGFYSPNFFDMPSIKDDIKEILPDKLNTDLSYLGATTYANEIVYHYGEEGSDDTYAYVKVRCLASPQEDDTKFEIYSGNYEVLPTGELSEEPVRADEYFGKDLGSGLEQSIISLNNSIDKTLANT